MELLGTEWNSGSARLLHTRLPSKYLQSGLIHEHHGSPPQEKPYLEAGRPVGLRHFTIGRGSLTCNSSPGEPLGLGATAKASCQSAGYFAIRAEAVCALAQLL